MTQKSLEREVAIQKGLKRYHGSPCRVCGGTEKFVSNSSCTYCTTIATKNRSPDVGRKYQQSEKGKSRYKAYKKTETFKRAQNKHRRKVYHRNKVPFIKQSLKRYGITLDEYDLLLEKQNNCCAVCKTHTDFLKRRLSVDHCHKTGKIRGLLCGPCNMSLGLLKEDIQIMNSLIQYTENNF